MGRKFYDDRASRLRNLLAIRAAEYYQKPVGEQPWASGPVDPALVAL